MSNSLITWSKHSNQVLGLSELRLFGYFLPEDRVRRPSSPHNHLATNMVLLGHENSGIILRTGSRFFNEVWNYLTLYPQSFPEDCARELNVLKINNKFNDLCEVSAFELRVPRTACYPETRCLQHRKKKLIIESLSQFITYNKFHVKIPNNIGYFLHLKKFFDFHGILTEFSSTSISFEKKNFSGIKDQNCRLVSVDDSIQIICNNSVLFQQEFYPISMIWNTS